MSGAWPGLTRHLPTCVGVCASNFCRPGICGCMLVSHEAHHWDSRCTPGFRFCCTAVVDVQYGVWGRFNIVPSLQHSLFYSATANGGLFQPAGIKDLTCLLCHACGKMQSSAAMLCMCVVYAHTHTHGCAGCLLSEHHHMAVQACAVVLLDCRWQLWLESCATVCCLLCSRRVAQCMCCACDAAVGVVCAGVLILFQLEPAMVCERSRRLLANPLGLLL